MTTFICILFEYSVTPPAAQQWFEMACVCLQDNWLIWNSTHMCVGGTNTCACSLIQVWLNLRGT